MDKERAKEIEYFVKLVKKKFSLKRIILFGSRAKGESLKHSDYDIIVVSNAFEGVNFLWGLENLYEFWNYDFRVDLPYIIKEFEKKNKQTGSINKAIKERVIL